MNKLEKLQKAYREKRAKLKELRDLETRTAEQDTEMTTIMDEMEKLGTDIDTEQRAVKLEDDALFAAGDGDPENGTTIEIEDKPIYRSRFPLGEQCRDMIIVAKNGHGKPTEEARSRLDQVDKRELEIQETRAAGVGMVEAVGEDGGSLLQGESVIELMTNGWNNNAILSRTDSMTIGGMFYDQYGIDEDSRVDDSRGGGIRWYSDKELAEIEASKTLLKKTRWEPKRLTGLYFMSNEIQQDVPALQSEMNKLFEEELAFKKQEMVYRGTGSGEAMGLLVAPNIISQAKESSQDPDTIVHRNTTKMLSRIHLKNLNSVVWIINQNTLDQLLNMTIGVGTGGTISNAFMPNFAGAPGVIGTLWGYPVLPIEQASSIGDLGDIMLTDLSQYKTVDRGGVETAISGHIKFLNNQTAVRFVTHFDGQPKQKAPLTPNKGTSTSSTVLLAAR